MQTLTIATRFRGPPNPPMEVTSRDSSATLAARTVNVRLLKPPPLNVGLAVSVLDDGGLRVLRGDEPIGEAHPATLTLASPPAPDYLEAVEASRHYAGFRHHHFPSCFVCGTQRVRGDGLRIFAGPIAERGVVAAPWVPDASLDAGDGKVRAGVHGGRARLPGLLRGRAGGSHDAARGIHGARRSARAHRRVVHARRLAPRWRAAASERRVRRSSMARASCAGARGHCGSSRERR